MNRFVYQLIATIFWSCLAIPANADDTTQRPLIRWVDPMGVRPSVTIREFPSGASAQNIYENIAACAAENSSEHLSRFANFHRDASDGDVEKQIILIKDVVEKHCGRIYWIYGKGGFRRKFSVDWVFFGGAVRRAIYLKVYRTPPLMSKGFANIKVYPIAPDGWHTMMILADCLVETAPRSADSLVRAKFGSDAEKIAILELSNFVAECHSIPGTIDIDRSYLRATINDAIYAHSAGIVTKISPVVRSNDRCSEQLRWWEATCPR